MTSNLLHTTASFSSGYFASCSFYIALFVIFKSIVTIPNIKEHNFSHVRGKNMFYLIINHIFHLAATLDRKSKTRTYIRKCFRKSGGNRKW